MAKNNVVNFAPTGEKKKRRIPQYVGLVIGLCIAAFVCSVFVILAINDFDIGKALGAREATTSDEEVSEVMSSEAESLSGGVVQSVNFLVMCSDEGELVFSQLISVDSANRKIRIKPLPLDYTLEFGSEKMSISEALGNKSYAVIKEAFLSRNTVISKYVHVTEDNFKRLMTKVGAVPIEIQGNYEVNIDAVKYTFSPGTQSMTSDTLIKYMRFAETGEAALRIQGSAVADIFRQHFTQDNFIRGESFFSSLINFVDTDITAFDYSAAQAVLSDMFSGEISVAVVS